MRRLKGRPGDMNSAATCLTDAKERRANSITSTLALEILLIIFSLTFVPVSVFLTAMITCTSCNARTRVVSMPMSLVAPKSTQKNHGDT